MFLRFTEVTFLCTQGPLNIPVKIEYDIYYWTSPGDDLALFQSYVEVAQVGDLNPERISLGDFGNPLCRENRCRHFGGVVVCQEGEHWEVGAHHHQGLLAWRQGDLADDGELVVDFFVRNAAGYIIDIAGSLLGNPCLLG